MKVAINNFISGLNRVNSFLTLDRLNQKIHTTAIAWTKQCTIQVGPQFTEDSVFENDPTSFETLRKLQQSDFQDIAFQDFIAQAVSSSSQIGCYGAAISLTGLFPVPLESIPSCLLIVPWWASSKWVEWPCLNLLLASTQISQPKKRFLHKWTYYTEDETADWCFKNRKKSFYACALGIFSLYAYVAYQRPPLTRILFEKATPSLEKVTNNFNVSSSA
jgi:hypothetical protein